jgi:hypothetical protein
MGVEQKTEQREAVNFNCLSFDTLNRVTNTGRSINDFKIQYYLNDCWFIKKEELKFAICRSFKH